MSPAPKNPDEPHFGDLFMTITDIEDAASEIIQLLSDYKTENSSKREMRIDPVVYAYFQAQFGHMSRQFYVRMHSKPKPQRIDFRYGTSNPVVFEFAVRTELSEGTLYGSQNVTELCKLTRVIPSHARKRVLLLLDLCSQPINKEQLKKTYDKLNAGKGNFQRHPVRVIYANKSAVYHFSWKPLA